MTNDHLTEEERLETTNGDALKNRKPAFVHSADQEHEWA